VPKIDTEERTAWAFLVLAAERMYSYTHREHREPIDSERVGILMAIDGRARVLLRDKFGQNLDTIFDRATILYDEVQAQVKAKVEAENALHADFERLMAEAKEAKK
jgi:hypothetical protein